MTKKRHISVITIIVLGLFTGCNMDTRNDEEIKDLVNEKKDDLLFLSFWPGMTEIDFKRVVNYENKVGNLRNNNFMFRLGTTEIPLELRNLSHGIDLFYIDSFETPYDGHSPSIKNDGSGKGAYYHRIVSDIEEILNQNYEPLGNTNHSKYWISRDQSNCKVVKLYSSIDFFRFDYRSNVFSHNKEKTKIKSASCLITLEYMACDYYFNEIEKKHIEELEQRSQKKQELIEAKKNNNKL